MGSTTEPPLADVPVRSAADLARLVLPIVVPVDDVRSSRTRA